MMGDSLRTPDPHDLPAPKVSVCMVTYNHEAFIQQAVDSALQQKTAFPTELVIGEDCSTDRTREIVVALKEEHPKQIRLLLHERNLGMMGNFLRTLESCRGEYIALLEGDDYWTDPLKLEKQVAVLDNEPDVRFCFHEALVLDEQAKSPGTHFVTKERYDVKDYYTTEDFSKCEWFMATASVVFRRHDLPNPLPSFFLDTISGDICLYYLLLKNGGKIRMLNEAMSVFRRHPSSFCAGLRQKDFHRGRASMYADLDAYYEGTLGDHFKDLRDHHRSEFTRLAHPLWYKVKRRLPPVLSRTRRKLEVLRDRFLGSKHAATAKKQPTEDHKGS